MINLIKIYRIGFRRNGVPTAFIHDALDILSHCWVCLFGVDFSVISLKDTQIVFHSM
jgi:hypothetical protein